MSEAQKAPQDTAGTKPNDETVSNVLGKTVPIGSTDSHPCLNNSTQLFHKKFLYHKNGKFVEDLQRCLRVYAGAIVRIRRFPDSINS